MSEGQFYRVTFVRPNGWQYETTGRASNGAEAVRLADERLENVERLGISEFLAAVRGRSAWFSEASWDSSSLRLAADPAENSPDANQPRLIPRHSGRIDAAALSCGALTGGDGALRCATWGVAVRAAGMWPWEARRVRVVRIGFTAVKGGRHVCHDGVELALTGPVGDRVFCLVDLARNRVLRTVVGLSRPGMSGDFIRWKDEVSWHVPRSTPRSCGSGLLAW